MTSKLKCPFCQQDLRKLFNRYTGEPNCDYECENFNCDLYGIEMPELVWQALIQTKQDLEIARQALKDARIFASTHCIASAVKTIDKALEQIDHKERK